MYTVELTGGGLSPIHEAATSGKIEAIKKYAGNIADINKETVNGATALHLAAINGHLDTVKELLKYVFLPFFLSFSILSYELYTRYIIIIYF